MLDFCPIDKNYDNRDYLAKSLSQGNPKQFHFIKHYMQPLLGFYAADFPANTTTPNIPLCSSCQQIFFLDESYFGKCSSSQIHMSHLLSEEKRTSCVASQILNTGQLTNAAIHWQMREKFLCGNILAFFLNTLFLSRHH